MLVPRAVGVDTSFNERPYERVEVASKYSQRLDEVIFRGGNVASVASQIDCLAILASVWLVRGYHPAASAQLRCRVRTVDDGLVHIRPSCRPPGQSFVDQEAQPGDAGLGILRNEYIVWSPPIAV